MNASEEIVFSKSFNSENLEEELPEEFKVIASAEGLVNKKNGIHGIIVTSNGPAIIAAKPILHSDGQGESRGVILMGSYLDEEQIESIAKTASLSMRFSEIGNNSPLEDFNRAYSELISGKTNYVAPLDKKNVAGYELIKDVYGNPVLVMRVTAHREVYIQGNKTIKYFVLILCAVAVLIGTIVLFIMEKLVLIPMRV
jgi:Predicted periplasmic ligand-binding sensor domain